MEGELISSLEEMERLILKKRKQKQLLMQFENNGKEPSEYFVLLKVELEEEKKIKDILKQKLVANKVRCEALESEVVAVRKDLEKFQAL
jgi:thioredoxin-related protein